MPDQAAAVRTGVQFLVILLALPLQYWLTSQNSESQRIADINSFLSGMGNIGDSWTHIKSWCGSFLAQLREGRMRTASSGAADETTPPPEVLKETEHEKGYFASSTEPRIPRPATVKYRVGQVLRHKKWGYRGVIVGWDVVAKAPEEWLDQMHPKEKPEWRLAPNYAVLVDTRDRLTPQMAYVVEENIGVVEQTKIFHPLVEHYFESHDGAQYISRPWHKKVYPLD